MSFYISGPAGTTKCFFFFFFPVDLSSIVEEKGIRWFGSRKEGNAHRRKCTGNLNPAVLNLEYLSEGTNDLQSLKSQISIHYSRTRGEFQATTNPAKAFVMLGKATFPEHNCNFLSNSFSDGS